MFKLKSIILEILRERAAGDEKVDIYRDSNWVVVRPLTHFAARKYGCHTNWCTSTANPDHFAHHNKDGKYLIYILNRHAKPPSLSVRNEKVKDFIQAYEDDTLENMSDEEKMAFVDFSRIALDVSPSDDGRPTIEAIFDANDIDVGSYLEMYSLSDLNLPPNVENAIYDYIENNSTAGGQFGLNFSKN